MKNSGVFVAALAGSLFSAVPVTATVVNVHISNPYLELFARADVVFNQLGQAVGYHLTTVLPGGLAGGRNGNNSVLMFNRYAGANQFLDLLGKPDFFGVSILTTGVNGNISYNYLSDQNARYPGVTEFAMDSVTTPIGDPTFETPSPFFATITGTPEPESWVLMILGFGLIGGLSRYKSPRYISA